jgi:hypothetical protein
MKTKALVLAIAFLCTVAAGACFAKDKAAYLGTWHLQQTEASITGTHVVLGASGLPELAVDTADVPPLDVTVVYEAAGDGVKITVDGVYVKGQLAAAHFEWTGKFDGTDYPVTGDPNADTRSYKMVDDHTFVLTLKKGGQVTPMGPVTVTFRGKNCTVKADKVTATYHRQ